MVIACNLQALAALLLAISNSAISRPAAPSRGSTSLLRLVGSRRVASMDAIDEMTKYLIIPGRHPSRSTAWGISCCMNDRGVDPENAVLFS